MQIMVLPLLAWDLEQIKHILHWFWKCLSTILKWLLKTLIFNYTTNGNNDGRLLQQISCPLSLCNGKLSNQHYWWSMVIALMKSLGSRLQKMLGLAKMRMARSYQTQQSCHDHTRQRNHSSLCLWRQGFLQSGISPKAIVVDGSKKARFVGNLHRLWSYASMSLQQGQVTNKQSDSGYWLLQAPGQYPKPGVAAIGVQEFFMIV